jgi:hypothetical protein
MVAGLLRLATVIDSQRSNPRIAALLAWILPGAGHVYAGASALGGAVFLLVMGSFAAGWWLVGERIFGFSSPFDIPVVKLLPHHVLPECGNLTGAFIAQVLMGDRTPDLERLLRLPRANEHLGLTLTACSGVLNLIFVAQAWWLARFRGLRSPVSKLPDPAIAALLSWVVPGLGHVRLGQRNKGLLLLGAITVMFALGLWFSGFTAADRAQLYWWWAGEIFFGSGAMLATVFLGPLPVTATLPYVDLGITLCCSAGLLNLVVMVDAFSLAEELHLGSSDAGAPAPQPVRAS